MSEVKASFESSGSIQPPLIIGRLVRFFLGIICLDLFRQIVDDIPGMIERGWPVNPISLCTIALGFYLIKPVVNIGYTANIKYWPQVVVGALTVAILIYQQIVNDRVFGSVHTAFLMFWMGYVFAHLGASFVIAAIIRTPGCEMRAVPHLWSWLHGTRSLEHYCPGPLTRLDSWERKQKNFRNSE